LISIPKLQTKANKYCLSFNLIFQIMARVCTYLNFPRNTEGVFNYYKSIFGGEFSGGGIARMGDILSGEGMPQIAEEDKDIIMHIELPILGGHVLMGTDATESMGFKPTFGNNLHISLEPDTRMEAKRLFDTLSANGKITMPLQEMFWGAHYGTCIDKFGVQWMFNCTGK
jgi:PhnB protein